MMKRLGTVNWSIPSVSHLYTRLSPETYDAPPSHTRPTGAILLAIAIVLTIFWQSTFEAVRPQIDLTYRITQVAGLFGHDTFFYYYYYLGLYPVYAEGIEPIYSQTGAESILQDHPEALRTERGYLIRSGDLGKIWLFSLDAWFKGEPKDLSAAPFNKWFFVLGLIAVLVAMWYADHFILGLGMVAFIGSHALQLYEVYADNVPGSGQVFSFMISAALWIMAFHIPLIFDRRLPKYYLYLLPIGTGLFFGTILQIRIEPFPLIAAVLACYLLLRGVPRRTKAAMSLLLLLVFAGTFEGWNYYWDSKLQQSHDVVAQAGGTPYPGGLLRNHSFWHPVWVGLGDFGQKYGYAADDVAAHDYATPIMQREGLLDFDMIGTEKSTAWYDDRHLYYKVIWTIPQYADILRDKVLGDIARDPSWYLGVLGQRLARILTVVVPARLAWGTNWVSLPLGGWLLVPTLLGLILLRRWTMVKLLGFTLPLAATAFLIYSGGGITYYSIYLQIVAAIYFAAAWYAVRFVGGQVWGLVQKQSVRICRTA